MMKSVMVIPVTVELKSVLRYKAMNIYAILNSEQMSSHQVSRFHPVIKESTGIKKLRRASLPCAAR